MRAPAVLNRGPSLQEKSLLLTVEEAACELRIGRTQTYELVMRAKIPSVKIGRRRLVVRDGLEEYVRGLLHGLPQDY